MTSKIEHAPKTKLSDDWPDFKNKLDRVHPLYDQHPTQPRLSEDDLGSGHGL